MFAQVEILQSILGKYQNIVAANSV